MTPTNAFRLYRAEPPAQGWLAKAVVRVADRPGSLAALASLVAAHGLNITAFHFDRSEHTRRVLLEATAEDRSHALAARDDLAAGGWLDGDPHEPGLELGVIDARSILRMEVRLEHRPGALAAFAEILRDHGANVIQMSYDEDVAPESAAISLVTADPAEIDRLLKEMNERGYLYTLRYRGAGQREVDDIIGLNLIERFYFQLGRLMGTENAGRVRRLVDSSRTLTDAMAAFGRETGRNWEAGEVLTKVLALASASLTRTGERFAWRRLPPLAAGKATLHAFKLPTGSNFLLLEGAGELVVGDGGYGHYYGDVKRMLREEGFDPAGVKRIYLTHADADHAGISGHFAAEFGCPVHLHPGARPVLEEENRAAGSGSPLEGLNHLYTVLINGFTGFSVPADFVPYGRGETREEGGFRLVDRVEAAGEWFDVLESAGGHVPGMVFLVSPGAGLAFTADYLLNTSSLEQREKEVLNLPKDMMTSTNADSDLFKREMERLRAYLLDLDAKLGEKGGWLTIVPGHGDWYPASALR